MSKPLLLIILAFIIPISAQGQFFLRDSTNCELIKGNTLSTWPVIELDMPLQSMAAYVVADTLCRLFTEDELVNIAHSLSDDSIALGLKALIAAQDYDYLRYNHIQNFTWKVRPANYKSDYMALERVLEREYFSRVAPENGFDSIRAFSRGPIVLAHVEYVSMHLDSSLRRMDRPKVSEVYCADVTIDSSIFGATNPSACYPQIEGTDACIIGLTWSSPNAEEFSKYIDNFTYEEYGPDRLKIGYTYIIFIDMWLMRVEGAELTYSLFPKAAFPVEDGLVHDKYNLTGLGEYIPVSTYIKAMRNGILKIGN